MRHYTLTHNRHLLVGRNIALVVREERIIASMRGTRHEVDQFIRSVWDRTPVNKRELNK